MYISAVGVNFETETKLVNALVDDTLGYIQPLF